MDGWIKISRSITDHWIFSNAVYFKWWIDLLLMANIKDNDVLVGAQVVKLKRGQMIASLNFHTALEPNQIPGYWLYIILAIIPVSCYLLISLFTEVLFIFFSSNLLGSTLDDILYIFN